MSAFPPKKWTVRFIRDMDTMECTSLDDTKISMEAFLAVKPASGEEGSFRFVLTGPEKLKLRFNIQSVLDSGLFAGMVAEAEINVGDHIQMIKNSVSSKWMDLLELVQSQDMAILDGLGEDAADEFIIALDQYKKDMLQETGKNVTAGISFRWTLGSKKGDPEVLLLAQVKTTYSRNISFLLGRKILPVNAINNNCAIGPAMQPGDDRGQPKPQGGPLHGDHLGHVPPHLPSI